MIKRNIKFRTFIISSVTMFIIFVLGQHYVKTKGSTLSWEQIFSLPYLGTYIVTSIVFGLLTSYDFNERRKKDH